MKYNNGNYLFMNRIVKIVSPITYQVFKVELNGEEKEMRELLGTIFEINPNLILGLRDCFNNFYSISTALKMPLLNKDPYNYYTVEIKEIDKLGNGKYKNRKSLNLPNDKQMINEIDYENNNLIKTKNYFDEDDKYFYKHNLGK